MSRAIDPQAALETMWKLAPKYAQAKADRVFLDEYTKTLRAILMKSSGVDAIGAQEREALAHPDYATHLRGLADAVKEEETMRWKLVAAQAAIDVWRTQESSNRAMDKGTR